MDDLVQATSVAKEKGYELIFEMPATIRVAVKVLATNQQDAIVRGFDKILDEADIVSKTKKAEIVSIDSGSAQLQDMSSFDYDAIQGSIISEAEIAAKEYKVGLFQLNNGQILLLCEQAFQSKEAALAYAKDVAEDRVDVSYCRVFDSDKKCIITVNSERRGFEIRYVADGQKRVKSGFDSAIEAITYILNFKKVSSLKEETLFEIFEINDLDRATYPKLITTVN